jgi:hypothetical protein
MVLFELEQKSISRTINLRNSRVFVDVANKYFTSDYESRVLVL